jgi:hypothetical protein
MATRAFINILTSIVVAFISNLGGAKQQAKNAPS